MIKNNFEISAVTAFGIESILANELNELGYENLKTANGKVSFSGNQNDIAKCNICLRTAERVLIKKAEFEFENLDDIFEKIKGIAWGDFLPVNGIIHVIGKAVNSKLTCVPTCQRTAKKAIIEAMKKKYPGKIFPENGELYRVEIALHKNVCTVTVDTTGEALHKRGYRKKATLAPLKETLAAAMVILSRWDITRVLVDPLCGSGTIPIEAALIGRNIPPGINRQFASQNWDESFKIAYKREKELARAKINNNEFKIYASDLDPRAIEIAKANAKLAGVDGLVEFEKRDVKDFFMRKKFGCFITNPPYGERLDGEEHLREIYSNLGKVFKNLNEWSAFILTSYPEFEKDFGKKGDKLRKLYNGKIKCYLYQYYGFIPNKINS